MDENMRKKIIVVLAVSTVLFLAMSVSSCMKTGKLQKELAKEKEAVFDLEKSVNDSKKDKSAIQQKVDAMTQELNEEKTAHQVTKKALMTEQLVNQSLKEDLQKTTKLKEALETDLKEALVTGKTEHKK